MYCSFFIGREALSILENSANCGLPIPEKLKATLAQFTEIKKRNFNESFYNPGHDKVYDSGAKNDVLGIRECDIAYVIGALVEKYLNNVGIETKSLQSDNLCNDTDYYNDRPIAVCDLANNWGSGFIYQYSL